MRGDVRSVGRRCGRSLKTPTSSSRWPRSSARRSAIAIRSRPRRPTSTAIVDMLGELSRDQRVLLPITNSGYGVGEAGQVLHRGDADAARFALRPRQGRGRAASCSSGIPIAISFRLATVFGMSPRMRLDLLVNDFTYRAVHRSVHRAVREPLQAQLTSTSATWRGRSCTRIDHFDAMKGGPYNVGLSDANLSKLRAVRADPAASAAVRVHRVGHRQGSGPARLHRVEREDRAHRLQTRILARRWHSRADQGVRDGTRGQVTPMCELATRG